MLLSSPEGNYKLNAHEHQYDVVITELMVSTSILIWRLPGTVRLKWHANCKLFVVENTNKHKNKPSFLVPSNFSTHRKSLLRTRTYEDLTFELLSFDHFDRYVISFGRRMNFQQNSTSRIASSIFTRGKFPVFRVYAAVYRSVPIIKTIYIGVSSWVFFFCLSRSVRGGVCK